MKKQLLDDHTRVKKKFIAPMNTIPHQKGLYYFEEIVPEILWIALIIHHLGISEAVRVLVSFSEICKDVIGDSIKFNPAHMSEYHKLNEIHKKQIVAQCHRVNIIKPIVSSLDNTLLQFDDCPIRFISNNNLKGGLNIILLKNVLRLLQNSGTTSSVITLATALYICATVGSVAVLDRDLKFEDVLDYPATDKSLLAASCIRSTHNALFAINRGDFTQQWQRSFWQACLLIEPFTITNLEDDAP